MIGARGSGAAHDVIVLGGGPAGTAAGLTLLKRPDLSVGVVESSDYGTHRVGESLTPGTRPLLEYLGVWDAFRAQNPLDAFGSRAAWGRPDLGSLDYLFTLHGNGWSLDRVGFDRMLAETFRARGGTLRTATRFLDAARAVDGGWSVRVQGTGKGAEPETLSARYLIDATGRRALLARKLGVVREIHDRLVGIGGVAELADGADGVESTVMVEARSYGWWYSAPVPARSTGSGSGRGLAVVLMSDADLVSRRRAGRATVWRELLAETVHTRARTAACSAGTWLPERPAVFDAHTGRSLQAGGEGWVAVGDALVSHDPLSSTGIPHALGSGVHGALVAADALFGQGALLATFEEGTRADFFDYLKTHSGHYAREGRWPVEPFWARRRTPVEIDPRETILEVTRPAEAARAGDPVHAGPVAGHLPDLEARELLTHCRSGRAVHEAVRAFADAHPEVPDQRVILGFQELVERGAVRLAGAAASLREPVRA